MMNILGNIKNKGRETLGFNKSYIPLRRENDSNIAELNNKLEEIIGARVPKALLMEIALDKMLKFNDPYEILTILHEYNIEYHPTEGTPEQAMEEQ